jgi:uncharacterized membrane protein SpoIIM required for sporulation
VTRDQFITRRQSDWRRFEILLHRAESRLRLRLSGEEIAELSALYRGICFDLSLVQSRDWGGSMSRYLNRLVAEGHNRLYRSQPGSWVALVNFLFAEFPRLLRSNIAYFLTSLVLFVLPGAVCGTIVAFEPSQAGKILPDSAQQQMEQMYSGDKAERESGSQAVMTGFYVRNNVGIAFRCFALGAFAGIGTVAVLVYNSIILGTVTGFLIGRGHSGRFFEFVIGHGAFELTAIVVSGAAGLMIGHALVHPGQSSRWEALRVRGLDAIKVALGAGFMLFVAALIEGFWSPSDVPREIKMVVGGLLWVVVVLFLTLAGRRVERSIADSNVREAAA